MNAKRIPMMYPLLAALLASAALVACDNPEDTATSRADGNGTVIAQGDAARSDAGSVANQRDGQVAGGDAAPDTPATTPGATTAPPAATTPPAVGQGMRDTPSGAAESIAGSGKDAADSLGDKVDDAVITTSVNAELAKDDDLSALQIDVDTNNGRVVLHGTAPSEAARARAGELASSVDGVVAVDNALTIEQK